MMDARLRQAARAVGKYCEAVTCEVCPYYQEAHPSGIVCGLNAAVLKRDFDEWEAHKEKTKVGRPAVRNVNRKRTQHLHIALTEDEKTAMYKAAEQYGISISMLMRDMIENIKRSKK